MDAAAGRRHDDVAAFAPGFNEHLLVLVVGQLGVTGYLGAAPEPVTAFRCPFQITGLDAVDELRESRLSGSFDELFVCRVAVEIEGFKISTDCTADNADTWVLLGAVPVIQLLEIRQPLLECPPGAQWGLCAVCPWWYN